MKKFLHFLFALTLVFYFAKSVNAEETKALNLDSNELFEQVTLSAPDSDEIQEMEKNETETPVQAAEINENMTLREKLKTVYNLEVDRYDVPEYLYREPLTHHFKPESKMDNIHVWGAFNAYNDMQVIGQTIDDAAGEAIDKCSKVMGLGYPGGPIIDRLARQGNPHAFKFAEPQIPGYNYSFSGLKTSFLYNLREWVEGDPDFVEHHKEDLAASLEYTIVDILMKKLRKAVKDTGIKHVAVAGGVSANNGLRNAFHEHAEKYGWTIYIPKFSYTTDNAAMIGITGYYKYQDKDFCSIDAPAFSKVTFK